MSVLTKFAPKSPLGDSAVATYRFLKSHRRFPNHRMLLNDYLFRLKITGQLADPLRVETTDKLLAKKYISQILGNDFVIPTVAVMASPQEVRGHVFSPGVVVKPSHMSGLVAIFRSQLDIETFAIERFIQWLSMDYYDESREQNYKGLEPRVIVEDIVFGPGPPDDYKVFCYMGRPRLIQVDSGRFHDHRRSFFDSKGKLLDFSLMYPAPVRPNPLPKNTNEMLWAASELSKEFEFVRIDMYSNGTEIKIGEITHCPGSAGEKFSPKSSEAVASRILFAE